MRRMQESYGLPHHSRFTRSEEMTMGKQQNYHPRNNQNTQDVEVLFDPSKPKSELLDTIAEEQAKVLGKINSNQLRRFFSDIKNLYRRLESRSQGKDPEIRRKVYQNEIEPLFKMVRSKASYAMRKGGQGQAPREFCTFLQEAIKRVPPSNVEAFELFTLHFEAVVGFLYGKGKVSK
ncbi:MAG: type III-A CRISPR-associated protein Csm2 [Gammaproteobacteria bacterium]|nr:MAG: type III-A CRISPR-associated protein Csm2 [Gammaproteobacteria bacterium]